jgi:hypothetical protein
MIVKIYSGWLGLPKPIQAALVSALFTVNTVLGTAWALHPAGLLDFARWFSDNAFQLFMAAVYGGTAASSFRALQAHSSTLPSSLTVNAATPQTPPTP